MPIQERPSHTTFRPRSHPRNNVPDDSFRSKLNSLDILVQPTRQSPGVILLGAGLLDGTEGLRLLAPGTEEPVFDLVAGCSGVVLTLHGDGGEQVLRLPWDDRASTSDAPIQWQAEPDANGYLIEVRAVVVVAELFHWTRSECRYSLSSESKGPITVFRPRRESPK